MGRWAMPLAVGIAAVGSLVLLGAMFLWVNQASSWAYDFRAYYDAALRVAVSGSPYHPETLGGPFSPGPFGLYLYAPPLALLVAPLTNLSLPDASVIWLMLKLAAVGLTCWLVPVSRPVRLVLLGVAGASAPFLNDIRLGNVSVFVTLLSAVGWRFLDRSGSGVAIALSALARPTMGIVFVWWLMRRAWQPVLAGAATAAAAVLVTLPFVGLEAWIEFFTVLRNLGGVTGVERNADLGSAVLQLGGPDWLAQFALLAGYAIGLGAIVLSLRRDRDLGFVVGVSAALLLSPLLWDHYLTQLLLPAALLASRGRVWGLGLPLLGWLPLPLVPFVAVAATLLPFIARPPNQANDGDQRRQA